MTIDQILEAIEGMKVSELNELVEAAEEKFGVSAAAPVAAAGAAGDAGAAAGEEKSDFDVVLKEVDAKMKIKAIKVVKDLLGVGLKDAKAIVDAVAEGEEKVIKEGATKEEADQIEQQLSEVGVKVELK